VVVANNCSDDTSARARRHGDFVKVVETPIGSKTHALNLGDEAARSWPRFYVDADIVVSTQALRDVAAMLGEGSRFVVAAPAVVVDYHGRSPWVQSFYKVWTQLPYASEGVSGGCYALSKRGRERFGKWPDIIADDEYARLMAAPHERGTERRHTWTVTPPTRLRMVAKIQTRARAGLYQLHARFPELVKNKTTNPARTLKVVAGRPDLWVHAPIYLGVMMFAKLMAHRKLRKGQHKVWERDETARAGA
jgi:hypothetical protein